LGDRLKQSRSIVGHAIDRGRNFVGFEKISAYHAGHANLFDIPYQRFIRAALEKALGSREPSK
jgi:hypothetical protein